MRLDFADCNGRESSTVRPICQTDGDCHSTDSCGCRSRSDEGAAAVEFALILVPFLLLAFGIISFGWVFAQQQILNHAVREGARAAVVASAASGGTDPATAVVTAAGGIMPLDAGDISVSGACGSGTPTDVAVSVNNKTVSSLVAFPPIPAQFNLSAKAVFRCEW